MKENKIVKKVAVNGGAMFTLAFAQNVGVFDTEQAGAVLNCFENEINVTETTLEVGDSITDDFGGEPVIAATHGQTEAVEINDRKASDYRDSFAQKMSGEGEK